MKRSSKTSLADTAGQQPKIAVLGGGAWGTALAAALAAKRQQQTEQEEAGSSAALMLYCRNPAQAAAINAERMNRAYLPDIALPHGLYATADAAQALAGADIAAAAFPAQATRAALAAVRAQLPPQAAVVLCSKGIERGSEQFMMQVAREVLPHNPLAILSGPSFAADVARGLPTALTLAAENAALAEYLARHLACGALRLYASTDIIGVEIGGALKNVLALAAGMAAGRGFGASAQAALITRGFAELRRIARAFGGKAETMSGLAVLGDLVLTCSSRQSRNYAYGMALAQGADLAKLPLAEGVATAPVAAALCRKRGLNAPLIFMVAEILAGEISLEQAVRGLLARPLKFED